ncbi:quinone oxidoreductase family protein [Bacillus sp. AK128]
MKAVVVSEFGSSDVLKVADVEIPSIQPREILIKVDATSVNYADIKARNGQKGAGNPPFIPGLDATGVIEEVGSEVSELKVGQRVISFPHSGTYSEYVVASELLAFEIPDSISVELAAGAPIVSFLSYTLLADLAKIEKGDTVVVHSAAGGVGSTAVQFAKLLGAGKVIGTVGNMAKAEIAFEAGADHVFSYEEGSFSDEVNAITGGTGADIILDSMAGNVTAQSLECLAPYGRLINFGNSSGKAGVFNTSDVHASCRSVIGFSLGTTRKKRPELMSRIARKVIPYLSDGKINIKIGKLFSLDEASQAQLWIESRQSVGKVLLNVR